MSNKRLELSMQFGKDFGLTVEDVVAHTGYNDQTIRKLANSGQIRAVKRFRRWYFSEKSVLDFIKGRTLYNHA